MSGRVKRFIILFTVTLVLASLVAVSLVSCNVIDGNKQDSTDGVTNTVNNNQSNSVNGNNTAVGNNSVNNGSANNNENTNNNNTTVGGDGSSNGNGNGVNDKENSGDISGNGNNNDNENSNTTVGDDGSIKDNTVKMDFDKLDARFAEVTAPIKESVNYIFNDLIEHGLVDVTNCPNYRITALRYFYGRVLCIFYEFDVYIFEDIYSVGGEKSEFLTCECSVSLENFTESYCDSYLAYRDLLWETKRYGDLQNVDTVKSMANKVAQNLLKDYRNYDNFDSVDVSSHGKNIILSQDCRYSDVYVTISKMFNDALALKKNNSYPYNYFNPTFGYAPIDGEDIRIEFGGHRDKDEDGNDTMYYNIGFVVTKAMYEYKFKIEFDETFADEWEWMYLFTGSPWVGYTPKNPNWFNPSNEEYEEFFDRLLKADLDFENAYFTSLSGEDTFLYF